MIAMKILRTLAAAAITTGTLASASAQVVTGDITALQQDGNWSSFIVGHGGDNRFRAATVSSEGSMMLDVLPPQCEIVVQFNLPFSQPSATDIPSIDVPLNMRIDSGDVHSVHGFTNPVAMGDKTYIVYLKALSDFAALYRDLKNGSILRIKETVNGSDFYYTFQLNGFDSAAQRAYQGCQRYAAQTAQPASPKAPSMKPKPTIPRGTTAL